MEETLEERIGRDTKTLMFKNVSGTKYRRRTAQALMNETLEMVTYGAYQTKLTIDMSTADFILEFRDTWSQCGGAC